MVIPRCAAFWLIFFAGFSFAQPEADVTTQAGAMKAETPNSRIEEVGPPVMYLLDDDGKLLPVVGIPFSTFEELYLMKEGLARPDQPPSFSIDQLLFSGRTQSDRVSLQAIIELTTHVDGWVRIPLLMGDGKLQSAPDYGDESECLLRADEDGFELWIHGKADQRHKISMPLIVPLDRIAGQTRLRLSVPHATSSRLSLQVPGGPWVANASDGSIVTSFQHADGTSEYRVQGLTPNFQLSWRQQLVEPIRARQNLNVNGEISVEVDNRGVVTSDIALTVHGTQRAVANIQVRLPYGAQLLEPTVSGYTIHENHSPDVEGSVWDVVFEEPMRQQSVFLRTQTEQAPEGAFEIAAYDVLDAAQQSGKVTVTSAGDWRLQFTRDGAVRRVSDSAAGTGIAAAFEYYHQPCSLQLAVSRKTTRVIVEPIYTLDVRDAQVELQALLKYAVRGAKAEALKVSLPGWQIDTVGPESLVRVDEMELSGKGPLIIPIDSNAPSEFGLKIHATRGIELTDVPNQLTISLPVPEANTVTPATIAVSSATNVSLEPVDEEKADFVLSTMPPGGLADHPSAAETPLYYRLRGNSPSPSLTVAVAKLPQAISIQGDVELLELTPERARVRQIFDYKIEHIPLPQIRLLAPDNVDAVGRLEIVVNGKPAMASRVPWVLAPTGVELVFYRVTLPHPAIGNYQIVATYDVLGPGKPQELKKWDVPLLRPKEDPLVGQRVHSPHHEDWLVQLDDSDVSSGSWTVQDDATSSNGGWMASIAKAVQSIPLTVSYLGTPKNSADSILVERAWMQTWLTKDARRDRAVYRVQGADRALLITLPDHVDPEQFQVLIDHELIQPGGLSNRILRVALPEGDRDYHVVELVYHVSHRQPTGRFGMELPRIRGAGTLRQCYWHLVLPENEWLLNVSEPMISANRWKWSGWRWKREPQLSQTALEQWTDATRQQPVLLGANEYLFGAFDTVDEIHVWTGTIPVCLLVCSGTVLVAGLLLIQAPKLRRPALLLPIAAGLFVLVAYNPMLAAVAGQASVLGLILVLVARGLHWMIVESSLRRDTDWAIGGTTTKDVLMRDGSSRVSTVSTAIRLSSPAAHSTTEP